MTEAAALNPYPSPTASPVPYRTWIEVSRRTITANFHAIQRLVGPSITVTPVVKAGAYGHGAVPVSTTLESAGAQWLAVSNLEEATELRLAGLTCSILLLGDLFAQDFPALCEFRLTPALHSLAQLRALDSFCRSRSLRLPFHLAIDSGLGRLGTNLDTGQVLSTLTSLTHARFDGLMTHLASPGDFGSTQTAAQLDYFHSLLSSLQSCRMRPPFIHLASSTPIGYGFRQSWGTMVRPALAIYGYLPPVTGPVPPLLLHLDPALSWKARILQIKDLPSGAPVGYNGTFRTSRPTRLAVIAAGYADGVSSLLSNTGAVIAGSSWAPIIGAVSMDFTTIDITDCPSLDPGDPVTLLGRHQDLVLDAHLIARSIGSIPYNVLCAIGPRVKRILAE